jgi:hypothetical protein
LVALGSAICEVGTLLATLVAFERLRKTSRGMCGQRPA